MPRVGSILVLTEDSAGDAHATVIEVVKRMLRLVVPDYQSHRLGFEPRDPQAQQGIHGTRWKSQDPRDHADVTLLYRTIATKLARVDGFVLFHIDGDCPWSARESSENVRKFNEIVVPRVRQHLLRPGTTLERAEAQLRRLRVLVPHYSIEAWLYQHTEAAIGICRQRYNGRDIETFETWRADRKTLDEVIKPKDETCLGSRHNLELACGGYPASEVFAVGCSYEACVLELLDCAELTAMLDATADRDVS